MPGTLVKRTWQSNAWLDTPPKYRRACHYDAFVPETLANLSLHLPADTAGVISHAEASIRGLSASPDSVLAPLAHLVLRAESIRGDRVVGRTGRRRGGAGGVARPRLSRRGQSVALRLAAEAGERPDAPRQDAAAWVSIDQLPAPIR